MPSKEDKVVKNVDFDETAEDKKKKMKKIKEEKPDDEEDDDVSEEDIDEDEEDDDDEDDDDEEDEDFADGLTDIGLYNVLGNFLVDDEGNSIGASLSTIAKELSKLNHTLKKYVSKS
jgi:ABC-type Zn2+ transport system substrate-binding protein/surface adhesin